MRILTLGLTRESLMPAQIFSGKGLFEVREDFPHGFPVPQDRSTERQAPRLRFRAVCKQRRKFFTFIHQSSRADPGYFIHIMLLMYMYMDGRRPGVGICRPKFWPHDPSRTLTVHVCSGRTKGVIRCKRKARPRKENCRNICSASTAGQHKQLDGWW